MGGGAALGVGTGAGAEPEGAALTIFVGGLPTDTLLPLR
jgi:hypothetical protein